MSSARTLPVLLATAALALTGCASAVMKNYIGRPVESVMIDYGPPTSVLDLGPGQRAYQWQKISTNVVSGSSTSEVRRTRHGADVQTTETPGYVERQECFYTFYARPAGGQWLITNFRKPSLECE
ncbi:hypothetical protein [Labrys neptuniae]